MSFSPLLMVIIHFCLFPKSIALEGTNSQLTSSVSNHETQERRLACDADVFYDRNYGGFKFPRTPGSIQGTVAYAPCPYAPLDSGARDFLPKGEPSEHLGDVHDLSLLLAAGMRFCSFQPLPEGTGTILPRWNGFHTRGCRSILMDTTIDEMRTILVDPVTKDNINQLMDQLKPLAEYAPSDFQSATTMVEAINHALEAVDLFTNPDPVLRGVRDELFFHLEKYTNKVELGGGQRVQIPSSHIMIESVLFPNDDMDYSYTFESFQLPSEAIAMARKSIPDFRNGKSTPRLQIKGYSNVLFDHWGGKRDWGYGYTDGNDTDTEIQLWGTEWRIYDVQFAGVEIANLASPISYTMTVNQTEGYEWVCAFWNVKEKAWSKEGMVTIRLNDSVVCEATHLTAFSVLLDPIPQGDDPANDDPGRWSTHDHILSIFSSVGSAFSIAGLILTMLTYTIFRKLRRERSNQILLNLCLSLFFLHLTSLSAGQETWGGFCAIPAALLHYFLLTSLGWMLIDAIFMYRILISVFVQPETKFLLKRLLIGWGIPIAFVVITAGIDPEVYRQGRAGFCVIAGHLNPLLYQITYLGPSILILLTNALVFGRIIVVLYEQNKRKRIEFSMRKGVGQKPSMLSPIQTKGAVTLFVVFGLGWIVGLLGIGPLELPMKYLHTILNSGQGMLLFILRVVLDGKVIRTVRRSVLSENESSYNHTSGMSGTGVTGVHGPPFGRHDDGRSSFSTATAPAFTTSPSSSPAHRLRRLDPFGEKLGVTSSTCQENEGRVVVKY